MSWKNYARAMLYFNAIGFAFLFLLQLFQGWLPLNPQNFPGVEPALALNTAISFVTNTNWQAYGGENTLSYLTQMLGMTVQNFVSAATGNAVLLALIRGITRKSSQTIGNFWVDLTRTIVYLLLPFCVIFALFFVSQGVIQTLNPYVECQQPWTWSANDSSRACCVRKLPSNSWEQMEGVFLMPIAPILSKIPTPLSNFFETFAIFFDPGSCDVYVWPNGQVAQSKDWVIFLVMFVFWLGGLGQLLWYSESFPNPVMGVNPVLEGKRNPLRNDPTAFYGLSQQRELPTVLSTACMTAFRL